MLRSILTAKQVVLLLLVLLSSAAFAQFRTVTVQNDPSNPVPTTIQNANPLTTTVSGTVNTNVVNTPMVTINGTVPVTVDGLVATAITNVPTVNITSTVPVAVGNTVSAAITNVPTVNINGTVPVAVANTVNAAITNVPSVNINGTASVAVANTVSAAISNVPTVNINGTVPVAVGNTVSAAITNVPTVNINGTVPISGNVGIQGTPNVAVSNLPLGVAGPNNTTVLLVKDLAGGSLVGASQAFQKSLSCATSPGPGSNCTATFNVPPGKQLVIEYLQVVSQGNVANAMHHFEVQTTAGGQAQSYLYGPGNKLLSDTASDDRVVRIYADPGSPVQLTGVQGSPGPGVMFNL